MYGSVMIMSQAGESGQFQIITPNLSRFLLIFLVFLEEDGLCKKW